MSKNVLMKSATKYFEGGSNFLDSPLDSLNDRELQVFELTGQGQGSRQIAQRLGLSTKTFESHREHLKQKWMLLRVQNSTGEQFFGLIQPNPAD